jgi:hypothetical protein
VKDARLMMSWTMTLAFLQLTVDIQVAAHHIGNRSDYDVGEMWRSK